MADNIGEAVNLFVTKGLHLLFGRKLSSLVKAFVAPTNRFEKRLTGYSSARANAAKTELKSSKSAKFGDPEVSSHDNSVSLSIQGKDGSKFANPFVTLERCGALSSPIMQIRLHNAKLEPSREHTLNIKK
jgi:hypothetical protein